MTQVILASQSKQRQEMLSLLGVKFQAVAADIDELLVADPDHAVRAEKVAVAKAAAIRPAYPEALIIAADTFIVAQGKRLEKPLSLEEARQTLLTLSGQRAVCYTGWQVSDPRKGIEHSGTSIDALVFRKLTNREIEAYITQFPVMEWAGAFSIKHIPGMALIEKIEGSPTGILGLPLDVIQPLLQEAGVL